MATKLNYGVEVGMYSYGSCFSENFNLGGTVEIGKYCSIAENVRYFGANHPLEALSTSPLFYNKDFGFDVQDVDRYHLEIDHDVWIGYGTIIVSGCQKIGAGAVIGAGSVVTKDVPPYAIVGGNPARVIKYRFSKEVIDAIEEKKWWELTPEQVMDFYQQFEISSKTKATEIRG
ncbi:CatB-related O-acetyltransferase [Enterococcus sp. S23]|uniref:CatB-related O-acetyltransferase n=1 Tax=unclassified Enterococcus TaxID=2608891 RepID=UPI00399B1572|nr:CatB-related O-acetyltransferase [Enterococcus sp. S23]MCA5017125.1 CatB-related O-acetyltransferase [Enterococcus sp. S22(2020)]